MSDFTKVKSFLDSQSIKGGLLALIALVGNFVFKDQFATAGVTVEGLSEGVLGLIAAVGVVWSMIGRFTADTRLVSSKAAAESINAANGVK